MSKNRNFAAWAGKGKDGVPAPDGASADGTFPASRIALFEGEIKGNPEG
jgi:hypothetical protein